MTTSLHSPPPERTAVTIGRKRQDAKRDRLADELAGMRAEIKALRTERDRTQEVLDLERKIENLTREKERLEEKNARTVREIEHKTGLLREKTEHEVANARQETELKVREENLAADKKRFADEMDFQRQHLQGEVDRIDSILGKILERLPVIEVALNGGAATAPKGRPSSSRKAAGD